MTSPQVATNADDKPAYVLETFIKTTKEKLWAALTEGAQTKIYHFAGAEVQTELKVGGRFDHVLPDGNLMLGGEIIAVDAPNRIEMTFEPGWMGPGAEASRCAYKLEQMGDVCRLLILQYTIPEGQEGLTGGWARIASCLKSYMETGETLNIPGYGA